MALRLKIKLGGKFIDHKRPTKRSGASVVFSACCESKMELF